MAKARREISLRSRLRVEKTSVVTALPLFERSNNGNQTASIMPWDPI
jgi:hypothetical protein